MKRYIFALAFVVMPFMALAQSSSYESTCLSATSCENGLYALENDLSQNKVFDVDKFLDSLDYNYLGDLNLDKKDQMCYNLCWYEAKEAYTDCLAASIGTVQSFGFVREVCLEIRKEKFKKCARENKCLSN